MVSLPITPDSIDFIDEAEPLHSRPSGNGRIESPLSPLLPLYSKFHPKLPKLNPTTRCSQIEFSTKVLTFILLTLMCISLGGNHWPIQKSLFNFNSAFKTIEQPPLALFDHLVEISGFIETSSGPLLDDSFVSIMNSLSPSFTPSFNPLASLTSYVARFNRLLFGPAESSLSYTLNIIPLDSVILETFGAKGEITITHFNNYRDAVTFKVTAEYTDGLTSLLDAKIVSFRNGNRVGLRIWVPTAALNDIKFQITINIPARVKLDMIAPGFMRNKGDSYRLD